MYNYVSQEGSCVILQENWWGNLKWKLVTTLGTRCVSQKNMHPWMGKKFHFSLISPVQSTEYVQDDCLRLRVVDVAVYSTPLLSKIPSWQDAPHCWPVSFDFQTEFTKRKQFNNVCYSPPFYEYEQGYKMLLHVFMNGQQSHRATHISVYAHLYERRVRWWPRLAIWRNYHCGASKLERRQESPLTHNCLWSAHRSKALVSCRWGKS